MRGRDLYGRGFWKGGPGPAGRGRGMGRGRGNPSPFCRFFPWLPRRWWAAEEVGSAVPGPWAAAPVPAEDWDEAGALKKQASYLQQLLDRINKRLGELGEQK